MFRSQGVLSYSLRRSTDDPDPVMVHLQFADRSAVDPFEAWYGPMQKRWHEEHAGSEHEIVERWAGDDVPGYTSRLG